MKSSIGLRALALASAVVLTCELAAVEMADASPSGPAKGTLIIIGGGSERGAGILEIFINRAGGPGANFVIVPTAGGNLTPDGQLKSYKEDDVVAIWKTRGLKNVRMLHTHDPKVADTEEFVKPLRDANAVWFDGDHPRDLLDSYANTLAYREFVDVLARGGVIAGNSAGATVLGSYLARGAPADPAVGISSDVKRGPAFAFLRKCVIDLQINTRDRWDDLIPVIKRHPDLLGIGLSESTAIVVSGDRFEVAGKWRVAVHDHARAYQASEKPYLVLSPGDVFNMRARKIEKLGNGTQVPPPLIPAAQASQAKSASAP